MTRMDSARLPLMALRLRALTEADAREIGREKMLLTGSCVPVRLTFVCASKQASGSRIEKAAGSESNPEIRTIIEDYAMAKVMRYYSRLGYRVNDKHATESYDLLCEKGGTPDPR